MDWIRIEEKSDCDRGLISEDELKRSRGKNGGDTLT